MGQFTFRKEERISKESEIKELFTRGSSFYLYPFKVLFVKTEANYSQVLISVSKRNFKRAVSRNRIKRIIKEAYRLNKNLLPPAYGLHIGFVYTAKEILSTKEIFGKMVHVLKKVSKVSSVPEKQS